MGIRKFYQGFKESWNWVWGSIGFSVLYWILESIRDVLAFQKGTIVERLFTPDPISFWMRILVVFIIILFGLYVESLHRRLKVFSEGHRFSIKKNYVFLSGLGFSFLYWVLESFRDVLMNREDAILNRIFFPDPVAFWMRMLAVLVIVLFTIYVQSVLHERKSIERSLKFRIEFERLITDISTRFINLNPDEIDEAIMDALQEIGEYVGVDRSYVVMLRKKDTYFDITHEWCSEGTSPKMGRVKDLEVDDFPWWMERLRRFENIYIQRSADIPEDAVAEREILVGEDVQSLIAVPIISRGSLRGFLGFEIVNKDKAWPESMVSMLEIVGNVISGALERRIVNKALLESEERYRQIVENSNDIIYETDIRGYFSFVNHAGIRIIGYSEEELLKKHFLDIIHPEYRKEAERFYKTQLVKRIRNTYYELLVVAKDGREIFIGQNVQLVMNSGRVVGFQGLARDITDRVKAEESMKEAHRKLASLDRMKSDFLSTVSHELRTPIAIMREGVSLCLDGIAGRLNKKQQELLEISLSNTDRLMRLVNDLLNAAKIEAGKEVLRRKTIDICQIVKRSIDSHREVAHEKQIKIKHTLPKSRLLVYMDGEKILQIFDKLLANAIQYTEDGGRINIKVEDEEELIKCSVSDTGLGIARENVPKVFEKFEQFDRIEGPGYKGTGVGLTIVKGLVEKHGGRIWLRSERGKGTTFWFTLRKVEFPKILIVDDDERIVDVIKRSLVRDRYRLISTDNGEEAVELAKEERPGLILLDMMLPGISGYEVIGRLKQDKKTNEIPIIIISGYEVDHSKLAIDENDSAIPVVEKPFRPAEIRGMVGEMLANSYMVDV